MSTPREVDGVAKWTSKGNPEPEAPDIAEYRARIATILDRGLTSARLALPPNADTNEFHYEYVGLNPQDQMDSRALGFEPYKGTIDSESPQSLHSRADGTYCVGDVMLMQIPKKFKAVIDQEFRRRVEAKHGKPGTVQHEQREERQFKQDMKSTVGLNTIDLPEATSTSTPVNAAEIASAVRTND